MDFGDDKFEKILPSYLVEPNKSRLRDALRQFIPEERGAEINYSNFYKNYNQEYFRQADLVKEIRFAQWDDSTASYFKGYTDAIIISNTCDISFENKRDVNVKQCLFAPLLDFNLYLDNLRKSGYHEDKISAFKKNIKAQLCTNIFYLPSYFIEKKEYIVPFDNIFWFPTSELNSYINRMEENLISSLSHFGFYLFVLKLSYHLCRLPEQCDREVNVD